MSAPLRILMISPQFEPLLGGYERAAKRLSMGLASLAHEVEVVTERRNSQWPKREVIDGLPVTRLWCVHRKGLHVFSTILSLAYFLISRARHFDFFHAHQYGWPTTVAVVVGGLLGKPVVLKLTSTERLGIRSVVTSASMGWLHGWAHRKVDICVATSERAAAEALSFGISGSRIRRIPNGLDTDRFRPIDAHARRETRRGLGLTDEFLAIAVGRLDEVKNYEMMIDAWSRFAGSRDDVRLVIVGDGPCRSRLEAAVAESTAHGSITLVGRIGDPLPWYHAADVYLLSSDLEGLSNSLMEALSTGTPMISTRVSGSEDVIAESSSGGLVEVGDAKAFADELRRFHGDPNLVASCGKEAREYAVAHYTMSGVVEAMEAAYRDLGVSRTKSPPSRAHGSTGQS